MTTKTRTRVNSIPLIIEPHPANYDGYPFITLIEYRDAHLLGIIDNSSDKMIKAYTLDLCRPELVDEELVIAVAIQWYENDKDRYPLSFEFAKQGLSDVVKRIYRSYAISFVTRIIGPLPRFEMNKVSKIKRRKRKEISTNIKVNYNSIDFKNKN